jgi:hypothetical protein
VGKLKEYIAGGAQKAEDAAVSGMHYLRHFLREGIRPELQKYGLDGSDPFTPRGYWDLVLAKRAEAEGQSKGADPGLEQLNRALTIWNAQPRPSGIVIGNSQTPLSGEFSSSQNFTEASAPPPEDRMATPGKEPASAPPGSFPQTLTLDQILEMLNGGR